MATRLWQVGFEINGNTPVAYGHELNEAWATPPSAYTNPGAVYEFVKGGPAHSGEYGCKLHTYYTANGGPGVAWVRRYLGPGNTHFRLGMWVYMGRDSHAYKTTGAVNFTYTIPRIFELRDHATTLFKLSFGGLNKEWQIARYEQSAALTTYARLTQRMGYWIHIGLEIKLHETDGYIRLYEDGALFYEHVGDTLRTNTQEATDLYIGPDGGALLLYVDDIYMDSLTSDDPPQAPPNLCFYYQEVIEDGVETEWIKSHDTIKDSGGNTYPSDHQDMLKDRPHDGVDALTETYVKATEANLREMFQFAPLVLPPEAKIRAFIPTWILRKGFGGDETYARVSLRQAGNDYTAALIDPTPWYSIQFDRLPINPATGEVWTVAEINATESGLISEGDFS